MTKAELFRTEVVVKEEQAFIKLIFSKVAKWTPKVLLEEDIPLTQYLKFLDSVLGYRENGSLPEEGQVLTFSFTKTTGMIIYKEFYFKVKLKDFYRLIEIELENLFIKGIIAI